MRTDMQTVLRYIGAREADEALTKRVLAAAGEAEKRAAPECLYRYFPIVRTENGLVLFGAGLTLTGKSAAHMLEDCESAVLLAGTLGFPFEAALRERTGKDMGEALLLDAAGSAFLETVLDDAEEKIKAALPGKFLTDRFSPGYGDLPLALQPLILEALGAEKRLGIHVNESFMMTPSKSVTAVLGVSKEPKPARIRGCAFCAMRWNCPYHEKGGTCHAL